MTDYRRLIAFGKSSFVISLPKKWVEKHKLAKGSVVALNVTERELLLYPDTGKNEEEVSEIRICVDNKEIRRIKREIISAYINSRNTIILYGNQLSAKATEIREVLHNLMALEVMEQTSDKLIAKDFLNMEKLDLLSLLRKSDMIIRSMMQDSKIKGDQDQMQSIEHRDADVNRLAFLMYRAVRHSLLHPLSQSAVNYSSLDLLEMYWQINNIEKIADSVKKLAYVFKKLTKEEYKKINDIYSQLEENFYSTMKAVYSKDETIAHSCAMVKEEAVDATDDLIQKHCSNPQFALALYELKTLAIAIHNVGRSVYS